MAARRGRSEGPEEGPRASAGVEELWLAALERGDDSLQTGRTLVTFREGAAEAWLTSLASEGLRVADAREFAEQAVAPEDVGDADALVFPEIGVALVGATGAAERMALAAEAADGPVAAVEPEYFVFADANEYLRGFLGATRTILRDLEPGDGEPPAGEDGEIDSAVLGATWGLLRCRVPSSPRSGKNIRLAVLDTGMDLRHPDFANRPIVSRSFVGQPVQDLHGHGTHCTGTACGPKAPAGATPRYGIGYATRIHSGKVLTNSGGGTSATVLAGMNWAIANRCEVISMSLGAQTPVQTAYTAAGAAALAKGCLIIAAAGNAYGAPTGAPANSPTIMAVASLDMDLRPSDFSNRGKIEIAAPGRDVFSSWPWPVRYKTISGTSMATPHVAGCAALWAETRPSLRAMSLWKQLQASARQRPYPPSRVGAGLVQAPQ
jgi:subtilisin family serine protease